MSDEAARRKAEQDHFLNPLTPMATPQAIEDADGRNAYNTELERQRRERERQG